MLEFLFPEKSKKRRSENSAPTRRTLGFESLENREMLSVTPLAFLSPPQNTETDYLKADWFEQLVSHAPNGTSNQVEGVVENEWLIQLNQQGLKTMPSVSAASDYLLSYGITVIGGLGSAGTLYVRMDSGNTSLQSEFLASLSCVDYFEQNYAWANTGVADTVNDPDAFVQWYLDTVNVGPAWEQTRGSGVVVAVLDTGIQLDHPDLQANLRTNPGEITGNGKDDDGNGFIDDVYGWNSNLNSNNINDAYGHGIMVSGVIGAVGNNQQGTVGIGPDLQLLTVKAGAKNFDTRNIISGINYVVKLKSECDVDIRVINASIGGINDANR